MAEVTFKFNDNDEDVDESLDIKLCAYRRQLYLALCEVNDIIRQLYNGKTDETIYLYPIETKPDEWDREKVAKWQAKEWEDDIPDDSVTEFVDVKYIVDQLEIALGDIKPILWE